MRIGKISPFLIGAKVRKPHWTDCSMEVLDVGFRYVVGSIYSHQENRVVKMDLFPVEQDDWELYVDAEKVIDLLPVRENDGR